MVPDCVRHCLCRLDLDWKELLLYPTGLELPIYSSPLELELVSVFHYWFLPNGTAIAPQLVLLRCPSQPLLRCGIQLWFGIHWHVGSIIYLEQVPVSLETRTLFVFRLSLTLSQMPLVFS